MFVNTFFVFLQILCGLQLTRTAFTKNNNVNTQIVFPGPVQELGNRFGGPNPNETDPCAGQNYCTIKPANYPQELFNKMFKGKIKEPIFRPSYVMTDTRVGDSDEVDNCESIVMYEPIYEVRNSPEGSWQTVIQAPDENFSQLIRLERCAYTRGPNTSCFTKFKAPIDLVATCMQKYSVWEVLVHDGKGGTDKIKVDLPSCCSCFYKYKEETLMSTI